MLTGLLYSLENFLNNMNFWTQNNWLFKVSSNLIIIILTLAVCMIIDLKTSTQSKIQNTFFYYNEKKYQRMRLNFAHDTGKNQIQFKISFVC